MSQLSVCVFAIIDSEDEDDLLRLVDRIEYSEFADAISPGIGGVTFESLDIVTPERFDLELRVSENVQLLSEESGVP